MIIFLAHFKSQIKLTCSIFFMRSIMCFNVLPFVYEIVVCTFIECTGEKNIFFILFSISSLKN